MSKHHQIAESLNDIAKFPWHGVARCSDGSAALVLPFLRATWELQQHNEELNRSRNIKWRDVFISGHFQDRWFRIFEVINKLTELETKILSENRNLEWIAAHRELPFWLDLFHFYVPMLLDATIVALGRLLSDAPASFPRESKGLFKEDLDFKGLKLRCADDDFRDMVSSNREWHDRVHSRDGKKTIRDSIVHRLSRWHITTRTGLDESAVKLLDAQLHGEGSDISSEDGLVEASRILTGFCSFLSSLPPETWILSAFEGRDLMTALDPKHVGGRFLPMLSDVVQIKGV